jgi:CRP-like cAMP-binding protein
MSRDWLGRPRETGLRELIARKRFDRAIELLREQAEGRSASRQTRMQLADVLVLGGRSGEACQVFLGLADEFAGLGFTAKAVALLKRVERLEPGRLDVQERLARLVGEAGESRLRRALSPAAGPVPAAPAIGAPASDAASPSVPAPAAELAHTDVSAPGSRAPGTPAPELPDARLAPDGSRDDHPLARATPLPFEAVAPSPQRDAVASRIRGVFRRFLDSLSLEPQGAAALAGAPPLPLAVPEGPPAPAAVEPTDATAAAEPPAATSPAAEQPPEASGTEARPDSPPETATAPEAREDAGTGVSQRLRGVFKRLLSPFGSGGASETAPADGVSEPGVPAAPGAPAAVAPDAAVAASAAPASLDAPPEPAPQAAHEAAAAEAAPEDAAPQGASTPPMSEIEFQERVLDVIEEIVQRPSEPVAEPLPGPAASARPRSAALAGSALGSSLLEGLSDEELLAVAQGLELKAYQPGDIVMTEGESGQSLFIIASGSVKVFLRGAEGRNLEVRRLGEGDFFGEISSISGRPRTATVTAAGRCELLELDKPRVDEIARKHPRVRERLESRFVNRVTSPETAAVRAVALRRGVARAAQEILEAAFGGSRLEPRTKLRLADALLRAGRDEDAIAVLTGLADDLVRNGFTDKAIAVLKKIERIRGRHVEELPLAPLARERSEVRAGPAEAPEDPRLRPAGRKPPLTAAFFRGWLQDVLRERLQSVQPQPAGRALLSRERVSGYARGLKASPLFEGFSDEALLAVIRGLRLLSFEAGDVIITEGETGESLFVLVSGSVKVSIRDPTGRDVPLCTLGEGQFFGEMSAISHRPRTATVTAAADCELLELEKPVLESIVVRFPAVRQVLEAFYVERSLNPAAAAIRGQAAGPGAAPAPGEA